MRVHYYDMLNEIWYHEELALPIIDWEEVYVLDGHDNFLYLFKFRCERLFARIEWSEIMPCDLKQNGRSQFNSKLVFGYVREFQEENTISMCNIPCYLTNLVVDYFPSFLYCF